VLLSRTGILGSGGTDAVELNDLEEFPEEVGEAKEDLKEERNPEVLSTPPVPEKPKPRPKVKKKVVKKKVVKKKAVKPKAAKPALVKKDLPVKKPSPPKVPAPKAVEKAPSDEPEKSKPAEASKQDEVKTPESEAKPSDESAEKPKPPEEWVDEDEEIVEETKTPVNDQVKEDEQPEAAAPVETEKGSTDEEKVKEEKTVPPQNEQEPSSTKSSGSVDKNAPSLDMGKARSHSQLRQVEGNPVPAYPKEALKKKWEGRTEVVYYVNPAGFVEKIQLKNSSGHSVLDNAALRALARYRYYPGQEGWVRHPVEFVLDFDKEVKETAPLGVRESAAQK
jgi:protein TonB